MTVTNSNKEAMMKVQVDKLARSKSGCLTANEIWQKVHYIPDGEGKEKRERLSLAWTRMLLQIM